MEILAPCGSPEHVKAAVYAGADAIYLGGYGFSARRKAVNFSAGELRETVRFCRGFGVKTYITVNILTRDDEWEALRAYLTELRDIAPDALIIQDLGVARLCRRLIPDMPLHASTQLSVHTVEGVRFCARHGFTRVVAARECDQETLAAMTRVPGIGMEAFIHGALCVSVSGQCLLSAVIGGRSGNRGLCAQPCRLDFAGGRRRYALSLKDLSLVRQAPLLARMGIEAVKIEGRMKRPEYVAAAVSAVRAALAGEAVSLDTLQAVFSRGEFTKGYFDGCYQNMGGIRRPEDKKQTDTILPKLRESMRMPVRRVPADITFVMEKGKPCRLQMSDGQQQSTVTGPVPSAAVSRPMTAAQAETLLARLGDTPFVAADMDIRVGPELFLSAAQMNALRRKAYRELLERRIERLTPRYKQETEAVLSQTAHFIPSDGPPALRVHCRTIGQVQAAAARAAQLVLPMKLAKAVLDSPGSLPPEKLLIEPDRFITDESRLYEELAALRQRGGKRMLCQNPAHMMIGSALGYTLHGGLGLHVFNRETVRFWAENGLADLTASAELRLSDALALQDGLPVGIAAYGRLPLMLLRRCPFENVCQTGGTCPGALSDRTNRRFPIACYGGWREMLNADLLWMADKTHEMRNAGFLSLLLGEENEEETAVVLRAYCENGAAKTGYTRGLYWRGVE